MTQGIDMAGSGWTNPEGWQAPERPHVAPPPLEPTCPATSEDGWTCDRPPGHSPADRHYADNGEPGGVRWVQALADASTMDGQVIMVAGVRRPDTMGVLDEIDALAGQALAGQAPAAWAIALSKIQELCRG